MVRHPMLPVAIPDRPLISPAQQKITQATVCLENIALWSHLKNHSKGLNAVFDQKRENFMFISPFKDPVSSIPLLSGLNSTQSFATAMALMDFAYKREEDSDVSMSELQFGALEEALKLLEAFDDVFQKVAESAKEHEQLKGLLPELVYDEFLNCRVRRRERLPGTRGEIKLLSSRAVAGNLGEYGDENSEVVKPFRTASLIWKFLSRSKFRMYADVNFMYLEKTVYDDLSDLEGGDKRPDDFQCLQSIWRFRVDIDPNGPVSEWQWDIDNIAKGCDVNQMTKLVDPNHLKTLAGKVDVTDTGMSLRRLDSLEFAKILGDFLPRFRMWSRDVGVFKR